MNFDKIKTIDSLLRMKRTGNVTEFALKVGISKSMLHRYLSYMRTELHAPIKFNRSKITYEYSEQGKLNFDGWNIEE